MKFPSVRRLLLGDKKKPTLEGGKRAMSGVFVETSWMRVEKSAIGQPAKDPTEAKKGKQSGYLEL